MILPWRKKRRYNCCRTKFKKRLMGKLGWQKGKENRKRTLPCCLGRRAGEQEKRLGLTMRSHMWRVIVMMIHGKTKKRLKRRKTITP